MITLVVPIYNIEQYLPRCMTALLQQTCRDYEILLIDDGSTDSSGTLCDRYATEYPGLVRVIHKENGGLSSARNTGIDHAYGEFIIFPDPDDWTEPNYVQAFRVYQRQYQADLVCLGHYVDTDTRSIPGKADAEPMTMTGYEARRGLILPPRMQGFCWNKLYRLDLIRAHGLYFPDDMGTTEDLYFTYRYLSFCRCVCHAPSCRVYHYYQRSNSSTHSPFSRKKLGTFRTYEHIIADCAEQDPELAQQAQTEICTIAVNLLWENESAPQTDLEIRGELRNLIRTLLPAYLRQSHYGFGRKFQTLAAVISPRAYMYLKKTVRSLSNVSVNSNSV